MTFRLILAGMLLACTRTIVHAQLPLTDSSLAAYIANIRAVDNHSHANTVVRIDSEYDALPLDGIPAFALPDRLRPDRPPWIAAYKALYGYPYADLSEQHLRELRPMMQRVAAEKGGDFPAWVLDQIGTEVMLANRIAPGPGLPAPRFRWVSYVDALLLPLSTARERTATPDYRALYPLEEKLLRRYLADLHIARLPPTLDGYLHTVVTPTLARQQRDGAVAVKFEASYLRALDFADVSAATARAIYARHVGGGVPSHAEYKSLQDYLFRYVSREAGRLGLAVHVHSFEGFGGYFHSAGSDPLLLEPAFNDSLLRKTTFVIVHGGGMFALHTSALLAKPNVYADMSMLTLLYTPARLAEILRVWLSEYPEKVLYGTDAFGGGPDAGWELAAYVGSATARQALAIALTGMMRDGDIDRARAEQIATMVLRGNASALYHLGLP